MTSYCYYNKKAIKTANIMFDFASDNAVIFGEAEKLIVT